MITQEQPRLLHVARRPLDVTIYDRSPSLSDSERAALATFPEYRVRADVWLAQPALARFFAPLKDVLSLQGITPINAARSQRNATLRLMGFEMHQRMSPYWGWGRDEWLETVGLTGAQHETRFPHSIPCRYPLAAIAYLLCDFTDIHLLRNLGRRQLAERIFGVEAVTTALRPVLETARIWGYAKSDHLGAAAATLLLFNRSERFEALSIECLEECRSQQTYFHLREAYYGLSRILVHLGLLDRPLERLSGFHPTPGFPGRAETEAGVAATWIEWVRRWLNTSTLPRR